MASRKREYDFLSPVYLQKILIMNNQWFNTSEVLELVLGGPPDVNDSDDIVKTVTHSDDRRKRGC